MLELSVLGEHSGDLIRNSKFSNVIEYSCSPSDLNLAVTNFMFCIHVK